MKINSTLLFAFFFLTQIAFGQNNAEKEIQGKITAESVAVEGINVFNSRSQRGTVSDRDGFFSLFIKEGDILVFSAVNLVTLRKKVTKGDFLSNRIAIQMTTQSIPLKEIIVNESSKITAENLGIIPYGQKKYSPAERKLYTATSSGGIDGLLNTISGRKAMLKKEIVVEKKENSLSRLEVLFENKYYTETLKIPSDYIRGFQYYCIEDAPFADALSTKNKTLTMFLIVSLAENYNKTIENEK
ncbi:carboxypeptidase-like regulatory domain-containing protein [Flavobacterium sp. LB3P45]|uniref:Carboxypeptidase-like regulatory domain-containing protein n=1 Tax=Flavobacterium fructosi TaxID=3230416 RepID=A0ABW6HHS1_9FLAO